MRYVRILVLAIIGLLHIKIALAYDFQTDGFFYDINASVNKESVYQSKYYIGDITLPETINNYEEQVSADVDNNIISFVDANVKAICVANWDENGDGELSKDEAAAVTYLGGAFYENTTITSFEELQYFVGIEDLTQAFRKCSNLKKVVIPNSVKTIGFWAFDGM